MDRNIQRKREWETRIKRHTHTVSDNIVGDYYTHWDRRWRKKHKSKDVRIHENKNIYINLLIIYRNFRLSGLNAPVRIHVNYRYRGKQRERETNVQLVTIYPKKIKEKTLREKESEKHASSDVHLQLQWGITYPETATHIPRQRERKKYESRDVRIHAKWTEKKYIAQLHAQWAERACSYTCTLSIIYPDAERQRERETKRETKAGQQTYIYTYNQLQNLYLNSNRNLQRKRERERGIKKRTYTPKMSDSIARHW